MEETGLCISVDRDKFISGFNEFFKKANMPQKKIKNHHREKQDRQLPFRFHVFHPVYQHEDKSVIYTDQPGSKAMTESFSCNQVMNMGSVGCKRRLSFPDPFAKNF